MGRNIERRKTMKKADIRFGKQYYDFKYGKLKYNGRAYNAKGYEFVDDDDDLITLAEFELEYLEEIADVPKEERRCVSSNYFSDKCKEQTDEWIKQGLWVTFCADCIGHTRAQMFENDGERYLQDKYGDAIQKVRSEYGARYYRLA